MSHATPVQRCPFCKAKLEACSNFGDEQTPPDEGDLTVCFYCSGFLVFKADRTVRKMSDTEFKALAPKDRDTLLLAAKIMRRGPAKNLGVS